MIIIVIFRVINNFIINYYFFSDQFILNLFKKYLYFKEWLADLIFKKKFMTNIINYYINYLIIAFIITN